MSVLAAALFCLLFLVTPEAQAADEARRLVALVDYIGGDYQNAVRDGTIINEDEYQEMVEFSSRSLELLEQLEVREKKDPAGVDLDLRKLAAEVKNKGDVNAVTELALGIKKRLIAAYTIITFPNVLPSLTAGRAIYKETCAQCHGKSGRGDGASVATMQPKEPRPATFTGAETMNGLSPFKAFNTTTFGIEGTAMPDFSALEEQERWQASFYIFSLRFSAEEAAEGRRLFESQRLPDALKTPETLATLSDGELLTRLQSYLPQQQESLKVVAYLRRGLLEESVSDPLLFAQAALAGALEFYQKGDKEDAYQKSVEAYLDGFELAEPALFAREPALARSLETKFAELRAAIKRGDPLVKVRELHAEIETGLVRASESLTSQDALGGAYVFFNAAVIILREGIEAALIVAAILALLRGMGAGAATRYIHLGWSLALLAGVATWGLAQTVLTVSGSQREIMEGLITLAAAAVLFYVSYWLISKLETKKWQGFIRQKVQEALTRNRILALIGISFFAVYREAVETILFYQALWLQSASDTVSVIWGFLVGLSSLLVIILGIFSLGLKIPLKQFFGITSALLYLLAFVFIGQGIDALQAAGWMSVTPLSFPPRVDLLGIYSTLETVLAQGIVLLALLAALIWLWRGHWLRVKGSAL